MPDRRNLSKASAPRTPRTHVQRAQLGVRMDRRLVRVLKGLAEFKNMTLGELLEEIVLHSFKPVSGHEGVYSASPHHRQALQAIAELKKIYELPNDVETSAGSRPENV